TLPASLHRLVLATQSSNAATGGRTDGAHVPSGTPPAPWHRGRRASAPPAGSSRRGRWRPAAAELRTERRGPERRASPRPGSPLHAGGDRRAQEGRVADAAEGRQRHGGRPRGLRHRRRISLRQRPSLEGRRPTSPSEVTMFRWYVINTYSGHENKVKTNLE